MASWTFARVGSGRATQCSCCRRHQGQYNRRERAARCTTAFCVHGILGANMSRLRRCVRIEVGTCSNNDLGEVLFALVFEVEVCCWG